MADTTVDLAFLRTHASKETLQVLARETKLCFECGGKLEEKDRELVCVKCGLVWDDGAIEDTYIPFAESEQKQDFENQWSPPGQLAFNKELGTNQFLSNRSFCRIASITGKQDLGLRARHIRMLTVKTEHPWIISLLSYGKHVCEQFNLHRHDEACITFANEYGRLLRKVGAYLIVQGKHWTALEKTAHAVFLVLFREFVGEERAEEVQRALGIDDKFLDYTSFLLYKLTAKRRAVKIR